MKEIAIYKRSLIAISFIILSILLLTKCINKENQEAVVIKNAKGKIFAGSAACASCHKNIYDTHIHTAHFLTSQPAEEKYISGSFQKGENRFFFNDYISVAMEKRDSGLYQVEYSGNNETKRAKFDIVVGSGTKGQTYITRTGNRLFQLPITYFTSAHQWSNSPGYPGRVMFDRPITSRCLECHSTYAEKISEPNKEPEEFDQNKIVFGVDCEKCHGPAAEHIKFQTENPKETKGKFIINPASFSRQQNLDLCALCHGGRLAKSKPSFSFEAGDKLADYFNFDTVGRKATDIDVHGNQYGLLAASKCFTMSQMTCGSCHNTHENESGRLAIFSQRCMTCHNDEHKNTCKMSNQIGKVIQQNCIDCHMPEQPSKAIAVLLQGSITPTAALMRTHFIKVYPEETEKVMAGLKGKAQK